MHDPVLTPSGLVQSCLELLAIKGEHIFLVSTDQDDWRFEFLGQCLQPGHVERAGALPLPPDGQGTARQKKKKKGQKGYSGPFPHKPLLAEF